jgi:DNA-binding YbaB/EbfC family protein
MTENNPFAGLGGEGGFDLNAMLEQAQAMQSQLMAAQDELAQATVEGSAGGVQVTLTGTGELTAVTIVPGSFDGADAESLGDLGDLVVAAYRDGKAKVDAMAAQALGPLAGGGFGDAGPGGQLPGGTAGF